MGNTTVRGRVPRSALDHDDDSSGASALQEESRSGAWRQRARDAEAKHLALHGEDIEDTSRRRSAALEHYRKRQNTESGTSANRIQCLDQEVDEALPEWLEGSGRRADSEHTIDGPSINQSKSSLSDKFLMGNQMCSAYLPRSPGDFLLEEELREQSHSNLRLQGGSSNLRVGDQRRDIVTTDVPVEHLNDMPHEGGGIPGRSSFLSSMTVLEVSNGSGVGEHAKEQGRSSHEVGSSAECRGAPGDGPTLGSMRNVETAVSGWAGGGSNLHHPFPSSTDFHTDDSGARSRQASRPTSGSFSLSVASGVHSETDQIVDRSRTTESLVVRNGESMQEHSHVACVGGRVSEPVSSDAASFASAPRAGKTPIVQEGLGKGLVDGELPKQPRGSQSLAHRRAPRAKGPEAGVPDGRPIQQEVGRGRHAAGTTPTPSTRGEEAEVVASSVVSHLTPGAERKQLAPKPVVCPSDVEGSAGLRSGVAGEKSADGAAAALRTAADHTPSHVATSAKSHNVPDAIERRGTERPVLITILPPKLDIDETLSGAAIASGDRGAEMTHPSGRGSPLFRHRREAMLSLDPQRRLSAALGQPKRSDGLDMNRTYSCEFQVRESEDSGASSFSEGRDGRRRVNGSHFGSHFAQATSFTEKERNPLLERELVQQRELTVNRVACSPDARSGKERESTVPCDEPGSGTEESPMGPRPLPPTVTPECAAGAPGSKVDLPASTGELEAHAEQGRSHVDMGVDAVFLENGIIPRLSSLRELRATPLVDEEELASEGMSVTSCEPDLTAATVSSMRDQTPPPMSSPGSLILSKDIAQAFVDTVKENVKSQRSDGEARSGAPRGGPMTSRIETALWDRVTYLLRLNIAHGSKSSLPLRAVDVKALLGFSSTVTSLALSSDEATCVVVVNKELFARVYSLGAYVERGRLVGHSKMIIQICISGNNRYAASSSKDKTVAVWDLSTCKRLRVLNHPAACTCSSFSPDGQFVATGGADGWTRVWNLHSEKVEMSSHVHSSPISCIIFSHGGNYLATGSMDRTISIYDWPSRELLRRCSGFSSTVVTLSFTGDSCSLVANDKKRVQVFDMEDGSCILQLDAVSQRMEDSQPRDGHRSSRGMRWSSAMAAPGVFTDYIVACSTNGRVALYDISSGAEVFAEKLRSAGVCMTAGKDSLMMVSDKNGNVHTITIK